MNMTWRNGIRILTALALALPAGQAQQGPKPTNAETVARPKKKAGEPESDQEKIPSRLKKDAKETSLPEGVPTFRSDVVTVTVDVSVLDNKGRFIPKIPPGNFRVLEDNVPQKISGLTMGEAPMTIALVVEFSNLFQSYWSQGWFETLQATYGFVQTLRPEDYLAVIAFDLRPEILSDFTQDRRQSGEALQRLRIAGFSESNMYDALTDTAERMSEIEGRKAILYIGSGLDTFSKQTFDKCRKTLQQQGVPIYAISILQAWREIIDARGMMGPLARMDFLQADNQLRTFARETGGQAYFPRFLGEFGAIFGSIHQALRNQYTLTYSPSNQVKDGKYRKLKVELVNPANNEPLRILDEKNKPIKYQILAKSGYVAPREVE
jgi:VWFA-related protein